MKNNIDPEYTTLKRLINNNLYFSSQIKKLFLEEDLTFDEKSYLLSCAIIFLQQFNLDKRRKGFFEFAYLIILKYAINFEDYKPLNEFAYNMGFYPISKLYYSSLENKSSIIDVIYETNLEKFKKNDNKNNFYQTHEQFLIKEKILNSKSNSISIVAPTSFGKSSLIIDELKNFTFNKAAIIVPSKSLLRQTYRSIKDEFPDIKIIVHDDMFKNEENIIGVLTQERAFRLLVKESLYFDIMFIDEAHNIFEKDDREILLSRVIRMNMLRNPDCKIFYLSPVVEDSKNYEINYNKEYSQNIQEIRVQYNLKEPNYYFYEKDSLRRYIYNRFNDVFYEIDDPINTTFLQYILNYSTKKNLVYLNKPKDIQNFSRELYQVVPEVYDESIVEIANLLKKYIHNDFIGINYIKRGIVYLHGKLPTILKEYLEYKFRTNKKIKYLIANSVVFEGMNFPLDSLFILNTYYLSKNKLINLIGRVNRLNNIFSNNYPNFKLLMPSIHFVDNYDYQDKRAIMKKKLPVTFRSSTFDDNVKNPTLVNFDTTSIAEKEVENLYNKKEREDFLFHSSNDNEIKKKMIIRNIDKFYENLDSVASTIKESIDGVNKEDFFQKDIIDRIYEIFIKNIDETDILKKDVKRLKEESARNFYKNYIKRTHWYTMEENIKYFLNYFNYRLTEEKKPILYIGKEFGDRTYSTDDYQRSDNKVYIDLNNYKGSAAVDIAIAKIKIENDFISYKISNYIHFLSDYDLITEEEFNNFIYGTNDKEKIKLLRIGINSGLIKSLEEEGFLSYLRLDDNGNLMALSQLLEHIESFDDYKKFQIMRFL